MPYRDGTGPLGQGPATGWGRGPCGRVFGHAYGYGRSFGFGRRFFTNKDELALLEEEEKILKEDLAAIQELKKSFKNQK